MALATQRNLTGAMEPHVFFAAPSSRFPPILRLPRRSGKAASFSRSLTCRLPPNGAAPEFALRKPST